MEEEGNLDCSLDDGQWKIIVDIATLLQPFIGAQKLLEGEKYVTVSLIPYLIYKIRKGLTDILTHTESSVQAILLAQRMLECFTKHWGSGDVGTVSTEYMTEGERRRPKGIPLLTLVASLVDPRTKFGPGIPVPDKNHLHQILLGKITEIAKDEGTHHNEGASGQQHNNQLSVPSFQNQAQRDKGPDAMDSMFDELNELMLSEHNNHNEEHNRIILTCEARAEAELLL
jgi:hypothetical protein